MLQREAEIYSQGKTPVRFGGAIVTSDAVPFGIRETAAYLREIQSHLGPQGLDQSIRGLSQTRGEDFAHRAAEASGARSTSPGSNGGPIGPEAAEMIRASNTSDSLPGHVREQLAESSGQSFDKVSIHNDANAHRAADRLNARAFTVGRGIYFARNEYQPFSAAGMHLLAHEAAHTVQQRGHHARPNRHFQATGSTSREEVEAGHFANSVTGDHAGPPPQLTPSTNVGMVHRAITFTHANDALTTNPVTAGPNETAAGFTLTSNPGPAFQWDSDITIHGAAGDPFANFEVGYQQVERIFGVHVTWGSGGPNETNRFIRPDHLPRRDADHEGDVFVSTNPTEVASGFAADGEVRNLSTSDTPGTAEIPWDNPVAGRTGNTGSFNYSDAFVTYISARDTTAGTGGRAFRDIANIYWNLSASGNFDASRAVGSRIRLTTPGTVNHGRVAEGGSAEFPAIHGGTIANGHDITTDR